VQKRCCAARTERRLRAASAERAGEVGTLPLLDKNDQDQKDADDDVQNN